MKNHLEIIKKLSLWNGKNIFVKKLSGGRTNFNYIIYDENKKYIARFAPKSNTLLGLNRKREIYNTKIVSSMGLGPKVVGFFPKYNLLVVEYIDGNVFSPQNSMRQTQIKLLAKLLKKLHSGPKFKGKFNPFKTIRKYISVVKRNKSWLPKDIDKLLDELHKIEKKIGLLYKTYPCHLDLVIENIISSKNKIKLLDWEYSSNSDYRFDLAMLSLCGNFSNNHDKLLLKEYSSNNRNLFKQIQMMKAVVLFREASWGLLQIAISPIKLNYKKYATHNLSLFRTHYRNL
ncbi:hypothetical protein A2121_00040 [Candidatus Nomurabacteria bacterium GWB1_40_6]|uniref:Aminoglycoside phosphotransferase domain-containing protein n=1 Tax=Candidatus Nomurabacteria bacterium GWB1_40_6 TaxID=1801727 RepID=A0A1F6TNQ4_9BACT|nr:MAG: hypothetical protein A2121_00040 [Candidatus Nomurabacteria bacterium GWB1_40_6]